MKKRRLLTIISFVFGLAIIACGGANADKSNGLELLYFGKKTGDVQQSNLQKRARHTGLKADETREKRYFS